MRQRQVGFMEAVQRALCVNYCNFDGRSSRSEYWWYCLFTFIVSAVLAAIFKPTGETYKVITGIVGLALLLPGLGLSVRRLHDIGKSGWWVLIGFIPLLGAILLIVWFCQDSQPEANEYGGVPNLEG